MDEGFIDLRRDAETGCGGDSFWPSFTDIMMVVVMIFMLASTLLMVRNWDLVRELRATIEAEREAEALARSMTETSATLEEQLAHAQHKISELRMQLMRANEINRDTAGRLARQDQRVLELEAGQQRLTASLQQARRDTQLKDDQLSQSKAEYAQLTEAYRTLQERLQEVLAQLTQAEQASQEQAAELTELRQASTLSEQQFVALRGDYDELRVKYDKLVRPARSAQGKHVISVQYWKEGEYYQIRVRDMGDEEFRNVTLKQLHQDLAKLKEKYSGSLYVKVIIPDDSGLSYSEAWGFTFDILKKYDYYHQD